MIFLTNTGGGGKGGTSTPRVPWTPKIRCTETRVAREVGPQRMRVETMIWGHKVCARAYCPHSSRAVVNTRFHMRGQYTEVYPGGVPAHLLGFPCLVSARNRPAALVQQRARCCRFENTKAARAPVVSRSVARCSAPAE